MAVGKVKTEIITPEKYLEKTQDSLWNYRKMPRSFDHPAFKKGALEDLKYDNLDAAKEALLKSYDEYKAFFKENPTIETPNTVFGMLDSYHWELLTRKHTHHHFEQFGLL
jgi:oxepin-CoA hydrolase/3-oxo-5,6-dehydrosuberyl-CoA semialdehyde dehydrogenase